MLLQATYGGWFLRAHGWTSVNSVPYTLYSYVLCVKI